MPESTSKFTVRVGLISLGTSLLLSIGCLFSKDGNPSVLHSKRISSPDAKWDAVVESVDNGLGFGLGALYDEIHLERNGEPVTKHGDPGKTVIFYVPDDNDDEQKLEVRWLDSQRLQITYVERNAGGPRLTKLNGISIAYCTIGASNYHGLSSAHATSPEPSMAPRQNGSH